MEHTRQAEIYGLHRGLSHLSVGNVLRHEQKQRHKSRRFPPRNPSCLKKEYSVRGGGCSRGGEGDIPAPAFHLEPERPHTTSVLGWLAAPLLTR
ncbi:hypothetical protein J6590_052567 [Homalodisca vitripennis]|nr:hypothetical protein J6590_052567 [Homalodisca vitripennis]